MRWLIILLFISGPVWAEESSGDRLAQPPVIILTELWHYNQPTPVYRVDIENADEDAVVLAAEAAVRSVYPEFKNFTPALAAALPSYVVLEHARGSTLSIYIRRTIVADWLMTS